MIKFITTWTKTEAHLPLCMKLGRVPLFQVNSHLILTFALHDLSLDFACGVSMSVYCISLNDPIFLGALKYWLTDWLGGHDFKEYLVTGLWSPFNAYLNPVMAKVRNIVTLILAHLNENEVWLTGKRFFFDARRLSLALKPALIRLIDSHHHRDLFSKWRVNFIPLWG